MDPTKTTRKTSAATRTKPSSSNSSPPNRCQHAGCDCPVEPGRSFCSDVCRAAEDGHSKATCGCGHPECRHT